MRAFWLTHYSFTGSLILRPPCLPPSAFLRRAARSALAAGGERPAAASCPHGSAPEQRTHGHSSTLPHVAPGSLALYDRRSACVVDQGSHAPRRLALDRRGHHAFSVRGRLPVAAALASLCTPRFFVVLRCPFVASVPHGPSLGARLADTFQVSGPRTDTPRRLSLSRSFHRPYRHSPALSTKSCSISRRLPLDSAHVASRSLLILQSKTPAFYARRGLRGRSALAAAADLLASKQASLPARHLDRRPPARHRRLSSTPDRLPAQRDRVGRCSFPTSTVGSLRWTGLDQVSCRSLRLVPSEPTPG